MTSNTRLVVLLGGSGYIGQHLMLELHGTPVYPGSEVKYQVAVVDKVPPNEGAVATAQAKAGFPVLISMYDLETQPYLSTSYLTMPQTPYCGIILAAKKDVNEAEREPHKYLRSNIAITINSMDFLTALGVKRVIFASSSCVYYTSEKAAEIPFAEDDDTREPPIGIYGYSKYLCESICSKLLEKDQILVILRYMNPVGCYPNSNLFPDIGLAQRLHSLDKDEVFVNRGNCKRDFIHVTDLASYHTALLGVWDERVKSKVSVFNVGRGKACSVNTAVALFSQDTGKEITCRSTERERHEAPYAVGSVQNSTKLLGDVWQRKRDATLFTDYMAATS